MRLAALALAGLVIGAMLMVPCGAEVEEMAMKMNVRVGDAAFTATLANNVAARALSDMLAQGPVSIDMRDYAGFEKVGPLGTELPTEDERYATSAGDIMLYCGDQIVMFYGSNSWAYTPIGRIDDLTGWAEALGDGNVTAVFSTAE